MQTQPTRNNTSVDREAEKGRVALKGFFNITREWGCSENEQRILLGDVSRSTLQNWKKLKPIRLNRDVMERISYILGIYKSVGMLYPTKDRAIARMRLGTTDLPFAGKSAMEFMTQGSMRHLQLTRRYFDVQRGWT
ncbi:antitoxin Xre-like helix-turn-helix domain-containing protein [Marinobacter salsuginis]|uniref:Antitoxin Xre-like helix-turn-helix domain-containing protein n=1 Tax=Marinobacter salsuginis TaxID=418719 RepID=A0A5M3Q1Y6_9GAMM|nr:antitoxin Xre-like helix-turn-helix domain-containing protein [Marinobacter salsuginis]GBO89132.1 hypothetical protein MSSD14B_28000 [Marinobacter salsuginis]